MRARKLAARLRERQDLSFGEIRSRSAQYINALRERRGWSNLNKLPTDEAMYSLLEGTTRATSNEKLLEDLRAGIYPRFFDSFTDPSATVIELRRRWPNTATQIIQRADDIVEGRFNLLGLSELNFGNPIDWHFEPVANKRSPLLHWSLLNYLNSEMFGDKKIIWELNRHQYFATLGQAYLLTKDERYATTFIEHINSWMDQNPPKLGINWASSLEVAFRSISWLWSFHFFRHSAALDSATFLRLLKFLYLNARHLETYLSTYFSPNTHLTGEALGLFYLGTLLPFIKDAGRWKRLGRGVLLDQLDRHVKPDGVYFEQSSYYHRYTTDFYLHFSILSRLNGEPLPAKVDASLTALLNHLMFITRPDGSTPFFGDDDGGRLMTVDCRPANDFRGTLAIGAALFGRSDFKFVADGATVELLWLMGTPGLQQFDAIDPVEPRLTSYGFRDGGYYVMRDGWSRDSNYVLFDCGPHGTLNCGHAHADALSFELSVNGKTQLVDPGTYTYTGSSSMRDLFRSSAAHNTLTVDDESSSEPAGPFSWKTVARSECLEWLGNSRFDFVKGYHDGYKRLAEPVTHERGILFLKSDYSVLHDRITSEGAHQLELHFHFDAGIFREDEVSAEHSRIVCSNEDRTGFEIVNLGQEASWKRENGWVSRCYGEKEPAPVFVLSQRTVGNADLITFLLPRNAPHQNRLTEIETIGGQAFRLDGPEGCDVLIVRGPASDRVETADYVSDSEITWLRFPTKRHPMPAELILLNGSLLEIDGQTVVNLGQKIRYLVGRQTKERFTVETSDGIIEMNLPIGNLEVLIRDSSWQTSL